jgi:hypothetical protein
MYILPAFTSINTPKTPLTVIFNWKYFFFEQGLSDIFLISRDSSTLNFFEVKGG